MKLSQNACPSLRFRTVLSSLSCGCWSNPEEFGPVADPGRCCPCRRFSQELVQTAHADKINSLAFPVGLSDVFATSSFGCVRVWHLPTCRELLRISMPNLDCKCVAFAPDGKSIVTGWSDGKIRAFGPQTAKVLYTINDAHHKAVTAIAVTSDSSRIISGGDEGYVRMWKITSKSQTMVASMKDHKVSAQRLHVCTRVRVGAARPCNQPATRQWFSFF